jgi:hypothetical protein
MHDKFFLFSRLHWPLFGPRPPRDLPAAMNWVVVQTSANIPASQYAQANNLLVMHGSRQLYDWYHEIWEGVWGAAHEELPSPARLSLAPVTADCGDVAVWSFPRWDGDPIAQALRAIREEAEATGERPVVRIAVTKISSRAIREELAALREAGADLKIVVSRQPANGPVIRDLGHASYCAALREEEPFFRVLPRLPATRMDAGQRARWEPKGRLHSKFMLADAALPRKVVEGLWGPVYESVLDPPGRRRLVWTGSRNYTGHSLTEQDELIVRVENDRVYEAYLQEWRHLWNVAEDLAEAPPEWFGGAARAVLRSEGGYSEAAAREEVERREGEYTWPEGCP